MDSFENAISKQRLTRYLPAANGDRNHAFRLYMWNASLCEAFYVPCQICEVVLRNGMHAALVKKYGTPDWHHDVRFTSTLPKRLNDELLNVIGSARADHGSSTTVHNVISGLSLGFWNHILSNNYRHLIWNTCLSTAFPHMGPAATQVDAYDKVDDFRNWRNRIFHHNAIFDKGPTAALQNLDTIIGWCCPETQRFVRDISSVSRIINARPRA